MLIADYQFSIEKQMPGSALAQDGYTGKLLAAFALPDNKQSTTPALPGTSRHPLRAPEGAGGRCTAGASVKNPKSEMVEPLSERELEVLRLVAQGLSNRKISQRLFLAVNTVKGHNQKIFDKLQVKSRTEAAARARELGLL
jgi:DNA-binding NarL/FixJ family response regulator